VLDTFITIQRLDDYRIWSYTHDSSLNFIGTILIYLTWISSAPLDIDLNTVSPPKWYRASSLRNNIKTFNKFNMQGSWQKTNPNTDITSFSYILRFSQRIRHTASVNTTFFHSFISSLTKLSIHQSVLSQILHLSNYRITSIEIIDLSTYLRHIS